MALKTRAELKAYFETGDTPTEAQFQDLMDSIPNFQDDEDHYAKEINITAFNGGGQANAYVLTKHISVITTVANHLDSVKMPTGDIIRTFLVLNYGANAVNLYPPIGGRFNNLAINAPYNIGVGTSWLAFNYDALKWGALW